MLLRRNLAATVIADIRTCVNSIYITITAAGKFPFKFGKLGECELVNVGHVAVLPCCMGNLKFIMRSSIIGVVVGVRSCGAVRIFGVMISGLFDLRDREMFFGGENNGRL